MTPLLLEVFWKSGVVLGAALVVSWFLRKRSADLRRLVLSASVAALFVGAVSFPLLPRWTTVVPTWLRLEHPPLASSYHQSERPAPRDRSDFTTVATQAGSAQTSSRRIDFTPWLIPLAWFVGAAILSIRFAVSLHGLRRLREMSDPVSDAGVLAEAARQGCRAQLWQSETIAAPITWGIVRPVILIPAGFAELPEECRYAVLCHELAHIRARDFLLRGLAEIARALIWFQPLMWIVRRRVREEQELACDNAVLASGGRPSAYAKLLMDWDARPGMDFLVAVGIANRSFLRRRLYALLDPGQRRDTVAAPGAAGVWLLGLAASLPLVAVSFTQDRPTQPISLSAVQSTSAPLALPSPPPPIRIAQTQPRPAPLQSTAPKPKFFAASIKPCQPGDGPGRGGRGDMGVNGGVNPDMPEGFGGYFHTSPGRLDVTCGSVLTMVDFAYREFGEPLLNNPAGPMRAREIIKGIPTWALSARYTIHAETDDPTANGPTDGGPGRGPLPAARLLYGPMLQGLLEDRFQLRIHREREQTPMYALTVATGGFKLQPMKEGDCTPIESGQGIRMIGPDDIPYCRWVGWPSHGPNRTLIGGSVTMERFAAELGEFVLDRNVFDRTGVAGSFLIRLEYAPDENTPCIGPASMCAVDSKSDVPLGPPIFAALEQQLGLKLEPTEGPREHYVIDRLEQPSQ